MTKKEYRKDDTPPSDMFLDAMSEMGGGSDEVECGWCGRTHFAPDAEWHERDDDDQGKGWKEYCEDSHKKNPDGVVLHYDCDGISYREFNGINFVLTCPCNGLTRYENFIWGHKDTIRNYLKVRIEHEYQLAQQQLTLNKLAGISK